MRRAAPSRRSGGAWSRSQFSGNCRGPCRPRTPARAGRRGSRRLRRVRLAPRAAASPCAGRGPRSRAPAVESRMMSRRLASSVGGSLTAAEYGCPAARAYARRVRQSRWRSPTIVTVGTRPMPSALQLIVARRIRLDVDRVELDPQDDERSSFVLAQDDQPWPVEELTVAETCAAPRSLMVKAPEEMAGAIVNRRPPLDGRRCAQLPTQSCRLVPIPTH